MKMCSVLGLTLMLIVHLKQVEEPRQQIQTSSGIMTEVANVTL